jgi:hypothetical protein
MSPGLHDAINACMCMYVLFVASGMHDQNDRSLSGALTVCTCFVNSQAHACIVPCVNAQCANLAGIFGAMHDGFL